MSLGAMKLMGLYIEQEQGEISRRFKERAASELFHHAAALEHATQALLRALALQLSSAPSSDEGRLRALMLVRSHPPGGVRGLVREFGLLRRTLWEVLLERGHALAGEERRQADQELDELLALAVERLAALMRHAMAPSNRNESVGIGEPEAPQPPQPESSEQVDSE